MGQVNFPQKVKLICGFIFHNLNHYNLAKENLIKKFGRIDFESSDIPFICTKYYDNELGKKLIRKFVTFKNLINPKNISSIKVFTNNIENKLSIDGKRLVNIDPGYLDLAKLVLATTKDFSHRIYLDKGIFAEITLNFCGKSFKPNSWTYPDYASSEYLQIFNQIREKYFNKINQK